MNQIIRLFILVFSFLFVLGLLQSCNEKNKGEWLIENVRNDTLLIAETKVAHPSTLILEINGQTDDSIQVHGIHIAGGNIQEKYTVDWYYPKISIHYKAYKAKEGYIRVRYYLP